MNKMFMLLVIVVILSVSACSRGAETTLSQLYPGDIEEVDKVEIVDGSSGERAIISNQEVVSAWIDSIKEIPLTADRDQSVRDGFTYSVQLYEGRKQKLSFTPTHIRDHYYAHVPELHNRIAELFENGE